MKILIMFTCLITTVCNLSAQVAINRTGTPVADTSAMLEIQKASKSKVRIASANYTDTSLLELSNRTPAGEGTDFLIMAKRETGLYFTTVSDLPANNNDSLFVMQTSGRIGIGKKNPLSKLDVSGDINLTGAIKLNSNFGTAGQVLTSNGVGPAQWRTTALSNTVRFAVRVGLTNPASVLTGSRGGNLLVVDSIYNLDPASVSLGIGSSGVTIKKTGLYHFEGFYTTQFYYNAFTPSSPPNSQAYIAFGYTGGFNYQIAYFDTLQKSATSSTSYFGSQRFSTEIYIIAPKTINIYSSIGNVLGPTNTTVQEGVFYGHLISE